VSWASAADPINGAPPSQSSHSASLIVSAVRGSRPGRVQLSGTTQPACLYGCTNRPGQPAERRSRRLQRVREDRSSMRPHSPARLTLPLYARRYGRTSRALFSSHLRSCALTAIGGRNRAPVVGHVRGQRDDSGVPLTTQGDIAARARLVVRRRCDAAARSRTTARP